MTDFEDFLNFGASGAVEELPEFKEYAWDFEANKFILDESGKMTVLNGNDALKIWITKALITERGAYLAYESSYGFELRQQIGKVATGERRAELKRLISECLLVNPYIKSVDSLEFVQSGVKLEIEIKLTTIYGRLNV